MDRLNIETLCTTDGATDSLSAHDEIRRSGWETRVRPTFRPDSMVALRSPEFPSEIARLSKASGVKIRTFDGYLEALRKRRAFFKSMRE